MLGEYGSSNRPKKTKCLALENFRQVKVDRMLDTRVKVKIGQGGLDV